jgi:hypothetical protein
MAIDILAIRERAETAAPGEWRAGKVADAVITDGTNGGQHATSTDEWYGGQVVCESASGATRNFIVRSKQDVLDLCHEVEWLAHRQAVVDRLVITLVRVLQTGPDGAGVLSRIFLAVDQREELDRILALAGITT